MPSSGAQTTSQAHMGFQRDYAHGRRPDVQRDILKEGSPQPLLQSHSSDLQAVVPAPRSVGSNLAQNQEIHRVPGLGYEQLKTFPRSVSSETWQAGSPQPLQHANISASRDVVPTPRSLHAHNEDLGSDSHTTRFGVSS